MKEPSLSVTPLKRFIKRTSPGTSWLTCERVRATKIQNLLLYPVDLISDVYTVMFFVPVAISVVYIFPFV